MTNHRVTCFHGKQIQQTADLSQKIVRGEQSVADKKAKEEADKKTEARLKEKKGETKAKDKAIVDEMLKTVKKDAKIQ